MLETGQLKTGKGMEGNLLPVTAKLAALSSITTRFFLDHNGVTCMRIDLGSRAEGDIGLVRFSGGWKAEVVRSEEAKRWKRWAEIECEAPFAWVGEGQWLHMAQAMPGSLLLAEDGLWLVVTHWKDGGIVFINLSTGAHTFPEQGQATVFEDWKLEGRFDDRRVFEVGGSSGGTAAAGARF